MKHALSRVLRGSPARALHVLCRSACSRTATRAVVALSVVGVVLAVILALGLHVNLSASAPRGLYRTVAGLPTWGVWVVACVSRHSAALALARGYLGPGPRKGGVQPVLKRVVAVAGDVALVTARMEADATVDCGTGRVGVKPTPFVETGTAWFVDGRGYLLTNAHVVDPAHRPLPWVAQELRKNAVEQACIDPVLARQRVMRGQRPELEARIRRRVDANRVALTYRPKITVLLSNGVILAATIVKFSAPLYLTVAGNPAPDSGRDLTLLRVKDGVYPALRPASVEPQLGEPLHILGFPGVVLNNALLSRTRTLEASVTTGTISGFDRDALGQNVIETDAPAAPGNSGGPAIGRDGSVEGVLTFVSLSPTSDNLIQGFNFLIPARDLVTFLDGTEVATPGESRFTRVWEAGIRDFFDGRFQRAAGHLAQADGLLPGLVDVSRLRAEVRDKLAHPPPRAFPWAGVAVAFLLISSGGYGVIWYRHWQRNRFRIMPSEVIRLLDEGANPLLLDVRKESAHLTSPLMIPGATYIDPGALERGDAGLEVDPDRIVVAYCA